MYDFDIDQKYISSLMKMVMYGKQDVYLIGEKN